MQDIDKEKSTFRRAIIEWGKENRRSFPWRETRDPYRILIAEVLLHRTKAEQVTSVYYSFLREYPRPAALAEAPVRDIKEIIRSLGLTYRALRLKKIGQMLHEKFDDQIPAEFSKLLQLPGVGPYIANAVLCFAFNKDRPILDSNVIRIIHRVFNISIPPDPHKKRHLWQFMEIIIPPQEAREFNLSLLDFASLICKHRNPYHEECPIKDLCHYYQYIVH